MASLDVFAEGYQPDSVKTLLSTYGCIWDSPADAETSRFYKPAAFPDVFNAGLEMFIRDMDDSGGASEEERHE